MSWTVQRGYGEPQLLLTYKGSFTDAWDAAF